MTLNVTGVSISNPARSGLRWIRANAEAFAKQQGISEAEANRPCGKKRRLPG